MAKGRPALWDLGLQRHVARKAGLHWDVRLVDPSGRGHSWAGRKPLPPPGQGTFVFRQPTHTREYSLNFSGDIPSGYGAGTVSLEKSEPVEVTESNDAHVRFNVYSGRAPQEFFMKRMGDKRWLLRNITPNKDAQKWQGVIPHDRPKMLERPLDSISSGDPDEVLQPKLDGAHGIVVLEGGRPPRVFSYRPGQNETGFIEHTHKFQEYGKQFAPAGLGRTILRAEITAVGKDKKPLPAEEVGGLLNSGVWRSRSTQAQQGSKLTLHALAPIRFDGKNVQDRPYPEQLDLLEALHKGVPMIQVIPTARTPEEKEKLLRDVREGTHPLTSEGVVSRNTRTGRIVKGKKKGDFDVYVREIVPGKREGDAGAILFSHTPKGKVVGRVGTGFSDRLRRQLLERPRDFLGRVAKVVAQKRYSSGALRAPVFTGWHIEKGRQPGLENP